MKSYRTNRGVSSASRRDFLRQAAGWSIAGALSSRAPGRANAAAPADSPEAADAAAKSAVSGWPKLRSRVRGTLLLPATAAYEKSRHVWNAAINRRPAAILICADAADVIEGVRFAASQGLKASVRGGGHNVAGRAVHDGALLIDLTQMQGVKIDARTRRAEVAGGATWGAFDSAAGGHGFATTGGMVSSTGVGGLTLGGGIGWLMRRYGLTIDNLHSAQVVLADGRVVESSANENPDLFWALRGGGGDVGVVTRFTYNVHPVSTVLAGMLWYGADRALPVLRAFRTMCAEASDDLTALSVATIAPPAPFLPARLHGRPVIAIGVCWCGGMDAGQKVLAPLKSLHADADLVQPTPYSGLQTSLDGSAPYGMQHYWSSRFLKTFDDSLLEHYAAQALTLPTPQSAVHLHQLGGAVSRGDAQDAAVQLRRHAFLVNAIGSSPEPHELERVTAWSHACADGFGPQTEHSYVNFSGASQRFPKVAFTDEVRARLESIKRECDPSALFV
jgi:hypothetical protein